MTYQRDPVQLTSIYPDKKSMITVNFEQVLHSKISLQLRLVTVASIPFLLAKFVFTLKNYSSEKSLFLKNVLTGLALSYLKQCDNFECNLITNLSEHHSK